MQLDAAVIVWEERRWPTDSDTTSIYIHVVYTRQKSRPSHPFIVWIPSPTQKSLLQRDGRFMVRYVLYFYLGDFMLWGAYIVGEGQMQTERCVSKVSTWRSLDFLFIV